MSDFATLLNHLHRGGAYANFWYFDTKETSWFQTNKRPATPSAPRDVYFSVHPLRAKGTSKTRGRNADVQAVNCLYAEFDATNGESKDGLLARVRAIEPPPSAIVDSGGGFHAYWLLSETYTIDGPDDLTTIDRVQKAWVKYAGGDPGAKDLARVLRVPGTMNNKRTPARNVVLVENTETTYDLEALQAHIKIENGPIPYTAPTSEGHVGLVAIANELRRAGADAGDIFTMLRALADSRNGEREKSDAELRGIAEWSQTNVKTVTASAVPGQLTWAEQAASLGEIEWVWDRWLPRGFVTLVVGAVEVGKSLLTLSIANSMLSGAPWPDNATRPASTGRIVWFDTEASEVMNIARARVMGVPMERIVSPSVEGLTEIDLWNEAGGAAFDALCRQPDVEAIVIDSLGGAHVRENDETVKVLMRRLARLAQETQVPVIVVHHPRKLGIGEIEGEITLDRVRGYSGIVQFARMVWGIERPDQFDEDARRLRVVKSNLARKPAALGFTISEDGLLAFTKDAPERLEVGTRKGEAEKFIREFIQPPSYECAATTILSASEARGINEKTLKRAKAALGVGSRKQADEWYWTLPKPSL